MLLFSMFQLHFFNSESDGRPENDDIEPTNVDTDVSVSVYDFDSDSQEEDDEESNEEDDEEDDEEDGVEDEEDVEVDEGSMNSQAERETIEGNTTVY